MTDLQTPPPGVTVDELAVPPGASIDDAVAATKAWVEANVPQAWRDAVVPRRPGGHPRRA